MVFEESGAPARTSRRTRNPSVRIVPATRRRPNALEVRHNGDWLEVTFSAPDIAEERFRYSVGRRYLLVWSDRGHPGLHHFVNLPKRVRPEDHILSFNNGVVDARLRVAP
jgi:hypothetical protein